MIRPITSLPQDPFPSICDITHLWYRMVATNNGWHYFDFVEVLCKMVSSTVVPLKIKLQYSGTYLLYSPPTAVFVAPVGQQPAHPPLVPTASLMGSAQATLQSQQDCQRSSTATPAQLSVVAATHAYTRGIGVAQTLAQSPPLLPATPATPPFSPQAPSSAAITQAQATDYDSDDSDVKAMVKSASSTQC